MLNSVGYSVGLCVELSTFTFQAVAAAFMPLQTFLSVAFYYIHPTCVIIVGVNLKILNLWGSVDNFSWSEPEDPDLVETSVGTFSWSEPEDPELVGSLLVGVNLKILNLWGSVGTFSWSEPEDPELVGICRNF